MLGFGIYKMYQVSNAFDVLNGTMLPGQKDPRTVHLEILGDPSVRAHDKCMFGLMQEMLASREKRFPMFAVDLATMERALSSSEEAESKGATGQ